MSRIGSGSPAKTAFVALLASCAVSLASAAADEPDRGQALYEMNCGNCHSVSVHSRAARIASDFAALRRQVARWNDNLALAWTDEEIDEVSIYLNNTYYGYPCPADVCKVVCFAPDARPR